MKIEWIGHACFRMTAESGTTVVTDPYDESVGIRMMKIPCDMATVSHEHHDHNNVDMLEGKPIVVRRAHPGQVGGVITQAIASYHDDRNGALRGSSIVRVFYIDDLKVVHMGDQGCMPGEAALDMITDADVMMIPVGGFYTIDAQGAKDIIDYAHPKCVIPMHYKTAHCTYPIAGVEPFLKLMGAEGLQPVDELNVTAGDVPQGVVLMRAKAEY